jgi:hypothetical protein
MGTARHGLTPDEAAYYAAWLGPLWPRYERRFAPGWDGRGFEWHAAVYPLWMAVPGLYGPLAAFAVLVFAGVLVVDPGSVGTAVWIAVLTLVMWPAVVGVLGYLALSGELGGFELLPAIMALVGVAFGLLAPSRIVAEGRRRWQRASARGAEVRLPRSVMAPHPLYALALLAAVVALAWPMIAGMRAKHGRVFEVHMRSDLRNLVSHQEAYFAEHRRFAAEPPWPPGHVASSVTFVVVEATDSGWAATARRPELPERVCAILVGKATPPLPGAVEGTPLCADVDR